jgi:hypothetical protein
VRLQARLVELGFADDLPGYLRDGYGRRRLPVLALARSSASATAGFSGSWTPRASPTKVSPSTATS